MRLVSHASYFPHPAVRTDANYNPAQPKYFRRPPLGLNDLIFFFKKNRIKIFYFPSSITNLSLGQNLIYYIRVEICVNFVPFCLLFSSRKSVQNVNFFAYLLYKRGHYTNLATDFTLTQEVGVVTEVVTWEVRAVEGYKAWITLFIAQTTACVSQASLRTCPFGHVRRRFERLRLMSKAFKANAMPLDDRRSSRGISF